MITQYTSLEQALEKLHYGAGFYASRGVSGGSIHGAQRLDFKNGNSLFIKANHAASFDMFLAEARGLFELKRAFPLAVPEPLGIVLEKSRAMLILPWIEQGRPKGNFWENFGRALGEMHLAGGSDYFGFESDNYIGSTPQPNTQRDSWIDFFREERLGFQGSLALKSGLLTHGEYQKLERVMGRLDKWLKEPDKPEPLHGDLWSGNYLAGISNQPWLIDPAFYYGHGEADLAMTEMFGSMAAAFYGAYRELIPDDGLYRHRKRIYNLYHYINHLNLFGPSYHSAVMETIRSYC